MFRKTTTDPKTLPFDELIALKRSFDLEIAGRQDTEVEALRTKVTTVADALGISVAELFGIRADPPERRPKKRRDAAKYRDPDNAENIWSGRGRIPKWMQEKLDQGAAKEQFQVL